MHPLLKRICLVACISSLLVLQHTILKKASTSDLGRSESMADSMAPCDTGAATGTSLLYPTFTRGYASRAVMTLYEPPRQHDVYDFHFANILTMAHDFTSISAESDIELVVAYVKGSFKSDNMKQSLAELGVRLLELPDILTEKRAKISPHSIKPCVACFSKIHLFGLEVYSDILYLDHNMRLAKEIDLQALFDITKGNPHYFGAVPSLTNGNSRFDTAVILFKPSISRMKSMLKKLNKKHFMDPYLEETFLNAYFSGPSSPSCTGWNELPEKYNLQHPNKQSAEKLESAQLAPHSFWTNTVANQSATHFAFQAQWKQSVDSLLAFQLALYPNERRHPPDVAEIPARLQELNWMVHGNTFTARFAILTVMTNDSEPHVRERSLGNRMRYIQRHQHISYEEVTQVKAKNAVWQKVHSLMELMKNGKYDWFWLLDGRDAMIMNGEIDLRSLVGMLVVEGRESKKLESVDIIIARDPWELNAGSFFVRKSDWVVNKFIPKWLTWESDGNIFQEQNALIQMLRRRMVQTHKHLLEIPQKRQNLFNSYPKDWFLEPTFQPGDFILHTPSMKWVGLWYYIDQVYRVKEY